MERPFNKTVEVKFMKKIKPGYYSIMPEMVAELKQRYHQQNPRQ